MIEHITLPNGVRTVVEQVPYVHSVAIGIWVKAGSRYENEQTNGMSHFVEHMMFKGTQNRTAKDIAEAFDEIGGHVNAFTSKEYTCFYAKVLDEHTPIALDVLQDMFFNSTFDPEEVDKEKQVVIEEIKMVEDTPDDWIHDLLSQVSMPYDPLGYPILGTTRNVSHFNSEDLNKFIQNEYTPEHTVITVVGNAPPDLRDQLTRLFGHFQRPVSKTRNHRGKPQFHAGIEQRVKPTEQAHMCLSLPGLAVTDEQIYSMSLLNSIVGGSMSSRLFQEIREKHGLVYSVYSYHTTYRDCGAFVTYAGTRADQVDRVFHLILDILQDVRDNGISRQELQKAKEQLKGSFTLSLESTTNRMSRLGKNELMLEKHPTHQEVMAQINKISLDDIASLAGRLFAKEMSLAIISPNDHLPESFRRDALV